MKGEGVAWPFPFGISGGSGTRLVYFVNAVEPLAGPISGVWAGL